MFCRTNIVRDLSRKTCEECNWVGECPLASELCPEVTDGRLAGDYALSCNTILPYYIPIAVIMFLAVTLGIPGTLLLLVAIIILCRFNCVPLFSPTFFFIHTIHFVQCCITLSFVNTHTSSSKSLVLTKMTKGAGHFAFMLLKTVRKHYIISLSCSGKLLRSVFILPSPPVFFPSSSSSPSSLLSVSRFATWRYFCTFLLTLLYLTYLPLGATSRSCSFFRSCSLLYCLCSLSANLNHLLWEYV